MIDLISMFPVFVAEDLTEMKQFYESHFGFQSQFFDPEFYVHLLHPETGTQIAFMVPNHPSQPEFLHAIAGKEGLVVSFEVRDAENALREAQQSGLEIVFELKKESFGLSHFMIRDPAGFIIDIVEHHEQ